MAKRNRLWGCGRRVWCNRGGQERPCPEGGSWGRVWNEVQAVRISGKGIMVKRKSKWERAWCAGGSARRPECLEQTELGDGSGNRSGGTEATARTLADTLRAGSHWRVLNNGMENRPERANGTVENQLGGYSIISARNDGGRTRDGMERSWGGGGKWCPGCYGLNCPLKKYVEVLTPSTCKCDLIWK